MHARLPDDLLDVDMPEVVLDINILGSLIAFSISGGLGLIKSRVKLRVEDVVRYTNVWWEYGALHELMRLARVNELDNLRLVVVKVSLVISVYSDLTLWVLELAKVDASCSCVLLEEVDEVWQVVIEILGLLKLVVEGLFVLILFSNSVVLVLLAHLLDLLSDFVHLLFLFDGLELFFSL